MSAPRPGWYWWLAMLASTLAVGIGSVLISVHVGMTSDRRWCDYLGAQSAAYQASPPQTPTGQRLAATTERRLAELHCRDR